MIISTQNNRKIRDALLGTLATVAFSILFLWVSVNWLSGCGESFPTAEGTYIQGECIAVTDLFRGPK